MKTRRAWTLAILLISFAFWFMTGLTAHYSLVDDRQWGIDVGLYWWLSGALNSRYAGNFFAVILCRSSAVKTVIMGGGMFAIPYLMARLAVRDGAGTDSPVFLPAFLLSSAVILAMPMALWRDVYGWVSGFGNYALSALFFLVWLLILRHVEHTRRRLGAWSAVLFFLSLTMGMFLENLSLLFLGASLVLALWGLYDRSLRLPFWACLAGSLLAVLIMFCNGFTLELLQSGSSLGGRRGLSFSPGAGAVGALYAILRRYLGHILPRAFLVCPLFALPMGLLTARAFWRGPLRPLAVLGLLPLGYGWYVWSGRPFNTLPSVFFCCLCWGLPLLALLLQEGGRRDRIGRCLIYLSAPLSLLPVAATSTWGERFYFFPLVMVTLAAAEAAAPLFVRLPGLGAASVLTAALMIPWVWRSADVLGCSRTNWSLMRQAVQEGSASLIILTDRYDNTWWYPRNPRSTEGANYYAKRYGLPMDMALVVLGPGSYEVWPDVPPEMWENRKELRSDGPFTPDLPAPPAG